jgi:hypothetical protein
MYNSNEIDLKGSLTDNIKAFLSLAPIIASAAEGRATQESGSAMAAAQMGAMVLQFAANFEPVSRDDLIFIPKNA